MATSVFYSIIRNFKYFRRKGCCFFYPVSCVFLLNMELFFTTCTLGECLENFWSINGLHYRVENVIEQFFHESAVRSSRYEALSKFGEHSRS